MNKAYLFYLLRRGIIGGRGSSPWVKIVNDFKERVEGDGGTLESTACITSDVKYLVKNPIPVPAPSVDVDAQAFITAASITDSTQQSAIDTLVVDLKTAGVWTKMKAIYPVVGGTASSHKFNLKDPRDLDAAFRLTFSSGWTHSSSGMQPAGSGTFANSYCNPNVMAQDSSHLSLYSRTNKAEAGVDMGCFDPSNGNYMAYKYGGTIYPTINSQETSGGGTPYTTSLGHIVGNRNNSTQAKFYQTGLLLGTYSRTSSTPLNIPIYLGAYNVNGASGVNSSTKQFAFASIGDGLSDSEVDTFNTAVQAFQTTLSREV